MTHAKSIIATGRESIATAGKQSGAHRRNWRRNREKRSRIEALESRVLLSATWTEQGPIQLINGWGVGMGSDPVSGSISALAADPHNANVLYAGSVTGGIWKTTNALSSSPKWTPLTDDQLSYNAISSLAISPLGSNIVFAGTGSMSSFSPTLNYSLQGAGIARSTDGGRTWTPMAVNTFTGRRIVSIVPTNQTIGGTGVAHEVVLAATYTIDSGLNPGDGLYRSVDGGNSFVNMSGAANSGLPDAGVTSLVADPGVPSRFYAAVATWDGGGLERHVINEGVYRSDNYGLTWSKTSLTNIGDSVRVVLSVHHDTSGNDVVYAASFGTPSGNGGSQTLNAIFFSGNQGASWTDMGSPTGGGFDGDDQFMDCMTADPSDAYAAYLSGCGGVLCPVYRVDYSTSTKSVTWSSIIFDGANGTTPHTDSKALVTDVDGNLLLGCDGGIFRLTTPAINATRKWQSVNGNIAAVEAYSASYDPVSKVYVTGTQDNSDAIQTAPGSSTWTTDGPSHGVGDGSTVLVDANQSVHPGTSVRYYLAAGIRCVYDANGNQISIASISRPASNTLASTVINAVNPNWILSGNTTLYASTDQANSYTSLGTLGTDPNGNPILIGGRFINGEQEALSTLPMVYGGYWNGQANPNVIYVGADNRIFFRDDANAPLEQISTYPGSSVQAIAVDPQDYTHVFVIDDSDHVWASYDEGTRWVNITGSMPSYIRAPKAITVIDPPGSSETNSVLVVGGEQSLRNPVTGEGGIAQLKGAGLTSGHWTALGSHMPNVTVWSLSYDQGSDTLTAGTLGRGVWSLSHYFQPSPHVLSINRTSPGGSTTTAKSVTYTVTFSDWVSGVDAGDFQVVRTGSVTASSTLVVKQVTPAIYTVTINGIAGVGTLGLNLIDNGSIRDTAGNPLTVANAPALFGTQSVVTAGLSPFSITLADVNNDGKPDVIVANRGSNNVEVFLGNGNGGFAAGKTFATGASPDSVAVGDLNGDGKPDLVVCDRDSNAISVLLGNGDGTFKAATTYAVGSSPASVALADVNNDGVLDAIVANYAGSDLSILLGNGNGTFASQTTVAVGSSPFSVAAADLNRDGREDLVVANAGSNTVSVLLGNGDGTFQGQHTYATGGAPISVAAADVNNDGQIDLVVANRSSNSVSVLLGNGDGTFGAQQTYAAGANPRAVVVADVNGDGLPDLVVPDTTGGISVLLGQSSGAFGSPSVFADSGTPAAAVLGDVNRDGRMDIVVANFATGQFGLLLGSGKGSFTGQTYTIG